MKRIFFSLLNACFLLSINTTIAQSPQVCKVNLKQKKQGVFKLKLILESGSKEKYFVTSTLLTGLNKDYEYSNCGFDSVDFMFNSNGIRKTSDNDCYIALTNRAKKRTKYEFTYKPVCNKTIYYVVRYHFTEGRYYKCVVELKHDYEESPIVRIMRIDNIKW